jgi:pilus assembly protein CpaE
MSASQGIIIVASEPETVRSVSSAIVQSNRFPPGPVCLGIPELLRLLEKATTPAVIIDLDPDPTHSLRELEPVIARYPHIRFIALSNDLESHLMLEAMGVGVRHMLSKTALAEQLMSVLGRVNVNGQHAGKHEAHGSVITVLSAGGGAGATTIAVNLANELRLLDSEPTLVVDMDTAYGGVAGYLGLRGHYGTADVLSAGVRIDSNLISTTAIAHPSGLHVLLSPATTSFSHPAPLNLEHLDRAIEAFKATYKHTVVDAPRIGLDAAANLAAGSALTCIVFQLTVKDVRVARDIQAGLIERGVAESSLVPVANRYWKRGKTITAEEAAKALGAPPVLLSTDWKRAVQCVNYGKLLSEIAKRSPLRTDIQKLASKVAAARATRTKVIS